MDNCVMGKTHIWLPYKWEIRPKTQEYRGVTREWKKLLKVYCQFCLEKKDV